MGLPCKDLVFISIALLLLEALATANGLLSVARLPAFAPALRPAHSQGSQFCSRASLYIRALRTRSAPADRWSAYAKPEDSKANKVEQDKVQVDVEKAEAITELRSELIDVVKKVSNALDRGFSASMSDREKLNDVLLQLAPYSPVTNPASALLSSDSKWNLIYSDAPDITGQGNGNGGTWTPKSGKIGQEIDSAAGTITNIVEQKPSGLFGSLLPRDALQLRIKLKATPLSTNKIQLKLLGAKTSLDTIAGFNVKGSALGFGVDLPVEVGFGDFEILYYDGNLRINRTGQGYFAVNERVVE